MLDRYSEIVLYSLQVAFYKVNGLVGIVCVR
jgi:hypothetical protein